MEHLRNVVKQWDYVRLYPVGDAGVANTFHCDPNSFDSSVLLRAFKIEDGKIGLVRAMFFAWGCENLDDGFFASRLDSHWNMLKDFVPESYLAFEEWPDGNEGAILESFEELYVFAGNGSEEAPYEVELGHEF